MDAYQERSDSPVAILLRCLACVVFHIDHFVSLLTKFPGHFVSKIPIIHNMDMIKSLKEYVTTKPSAGIIEHPTGIPPHVKLASQSKVSRFLIHCSI